ncbi:succinate dehydrogenase cytochrome b subunit [soil metagenome]
MAGSGIIFIGYVLLHMYGNLKAFSGEAAYNEYAEHLRELGEPLLPHSGALWIIRAVLIVSLVVHVWCAVVLAAKAAQARPVKYQVKRNVGSSISSRTMRWGGTALLIFIVWHLLQFTIAKIDVSGNDVGDDNPYQLLINAFAPEQWWMTVIYLLALAALAMHLHHGTFSACQTLGLTGTAASRARARMLGWVLAIVIAGGFSLVPIFTTFGVID